MFYCFFRLNLNCTQPPEQPSLCFFIGQLVLAPPKPSSLVMNMLQCGWRWWELGGLFWWALLRIKKLTIRVAAETNASFATLIIVQAAAIQAYVRRRQWVLCRSIKVTQLALIDDVLVVESGCRHSWQRTKRQRAVSSAATQRLWPAADSNTSLELQPVSSNWSQPNPTQSSPV